MANRVNPDELKEIISTSLDDSILEAFIGAANLTVTDLIGSGSGLSDDQLREIERWLAAHFLASTREPQAQSERDVEAAITYQGKTGMGLDFTPYGQMVKVLDTTGILASAVGMRKASLYAVESFD